MHIIWYPHIELALPQTSSHLASTFRVHNGTESVPEGHRYQCNWDTVLMAATDPYSDFKGSVAINK